MDVDYISGWIPSQKPMLPDISKHHFQGVYVGEPQDPEMPSKACKEILKIKQNYAVF